MLRAEQLAAPTAVTAAFGATTRATVGIIAELNRQISILEAELATHFETNPDADIYRSLPGLGVILGPRVLGEFGDDPNRYTTPKGRKNYAETSPLTITSGRKRAVLARHVRNRQREERLRLRRRPFGPSRFGRRRSPGTRWDGHRYPHTASPRASRRHPCPATAATDLPTTATAAISVIDAHRTNKPPDPRQRPSDYALCPPNSTRAWLSHVQTVISGW